MRTETAWTGPREDEIDNTGKLYRTVPPERWPYGSPSFHEACCLLHSGGLYCDCKASEANDVEWGEGMYQVKR